MTLDMDIVPLSFLQQKQQMMNNKWIHFFRNWTLKQSHSRYNFFTPFTVFWAAINDVYLTSITFKSTYQVCHWRKHLLLWCHPSQLSLSWFQSWHHWLSVSGSGSESSASSALDLMRHTMLEVKSFEIGYLCPLRTLSKNMRLILILVCWLNLYSHYPRYLPDFLFLRIYPVWPLS